MTEHTDKIEDKIHLLLTRYDGLENDNSVSNSQSSQPNSRPNGPEVKASDMTRVGILTRENEYLKEMIDSLTSVVDQFQERFQELSIVYNIKIERLREQHEQELNELHQQFKERLKKEIKERD